jgi:hypothetical protein
LKRVFCSYYNAYSESIICIAREASRQAEEIIKVGTQNHKIVKLVLQERAYILPRIGKYD